MQALINKGADLNLQANDGNTALLWAVIGGQKKIALALIDGGASPNRQNNAHETPLILAARNGETQSCGC